jgi:hypothetical protein
MRDGTLERYCSPLFTFQLCNLINMPCIQVVEAVKPTKWQLLVTLTLVLILASMFKYWIVNYLLAENRFAESVEYKIYI